MVNITSNQEISHVGVPKVSKTCIAPDYNKRNTQQFIFQNIQLSVVTA